LYALDPKARCAGKPEKKERNVIKKFTGNLAGILSLLLTSANASAEAAPGIPAAISAAISDPRRPVEQIKLDGARKPALVVSFAGVRAGDRIADFMPGNAYFTRIFSDVVGPTGRVYAFIPAEQVKNCPAAEIAGTEGIAHDPRYENIIVSTDRVANFRTPEPLDVLWTAQNYHDLHDSFMGPADTDALNKAFFNSLKPGGVFLVIDHVAAAGSGLRDTDTLHRIDPMRMRREIEAAGFIFEAQSNVLRNSNDNHTLAVFDPAIRGKTDQVVFRFRRPLPSREPEAPPATTPSTKPD
jgi:predicted methyltransferase